MIKKFQKLFAVLAVSFVAVQTTAHAQVVIGSGDACDNIVIQAVGFSGSPLWYQYYYTSSAYDSMHPLRGAGLLIAIATDSGISGTTNLVSGLSASFSGTADDGFFLFSLTYNGDAPVMPPGNYDWTYFVAGGTVDEFGGPPFFEPVTNSDGSPVVDPVPTGSWELAPVGASNRSPGNGNWDAWVFGQWADDFSTYEGPLPAIAPVPEPAIGLYLGLAFLLGAARFYQRRKNSSR